MQKTVMSIFRSIKNEKHRLICHYYKTTDATQQQLGEYFNMHQTTIYNILHKHKVYKRTEGRLLPFALLNDTRKNSTKHHPCGLECGSWRRCYGVGCRPDLTDRCNAFTGDSGWHINKDYSLTPINPDLRREV